MKYIVLAVILLIGSLLYINKEEIVARYTGNFATIAPPPGATGYYNPTKYTLKTKIDKANTGTINNEAATETKHPADAEITLTATPKTGYLFLGWQGACTHTGTVCKIKMDSNKNVTAKFDRCVEPFPANVYYPSVKSLERKLVDLAHNRGDTSLKITAAGEVSVISVEFSDGGVCAKFTEGGSGEVTYNASSKVTFLTLYKGKSVKRINKYHTHDSKSSKDLKENLEYAIALYDRSSGLYTIPPPSTSDLAINYYDNVPNGIANILDTEIIEKVISPDGNGYIYKAGLNTRGSFDTKAHFDAFKGRVYDEMMTAFDNSLIANGRTPRTATNDDVQLALNVSIKVFKSVGVTLKPFIVN